nr:elongation of very long chain fatty acids protein AAEL008004-like [Leptinotarsa decemlineata]
MAAYSRICSHYFFGGNKSEDSRHPAYNPTIFPTKYKHNRLAGWPLMSNPLLIMAITILYIYTAKKLGPALMENRKPFNLKKTLFVYNLMQVIFSSWLFYRLATAGWLTGKFSFICQPLDTSTSPEAMKVGGVT